MAVVESPLEIWFLLFDTLICNSLRDLTKDINHKKQNKNKFHSHEAIFSHWSEKTVLYNSLNISEQVRIPYSVMRVV